MFSPTNSLGSQEGSWQENIEEDTEYLCLPLKTTSFPLNLSLLGLKGKERIRQLVCKNLTPNLLITSSLFVCFFTISLIYLPLRCRSKPFRKVELLFFCISVGTRENHVGIGFSSIDFQGVTVCLCWATLSIYRMDSAKTWITNKASRVSQSSSGHLLQLPFYNVHLALASCI